MRRRKFIGLAGAAATWPVAARAEQTKKQWRIAHIMIGSPDTVGFERDSFSKCLAEAGYENGKDINRNHHFTLI